MLCVWLLRGGCPAVLALAVAVGTAVGAEGVFGFSDVAAVVALTFPL